MNANAHLGAPVEASPPRSRPGSDRKPTTGLATLGLLAPPGLLLGILFVAPLAIMASYSFWVINDAYQLEAVWDLRQYAKFLSSPIYIDVLLKSARMALLTTACALLLAFPLAYFIVRVAPPRWRAILLMALIVPGWVSVLIRTYAWTLVIGESGVLNFLLLFFGVTEEPIRVLFTETAVVIGLVYIYLPYMLVPIYAALDRLDPSLLEAAENLGAGPVDRFLRIVVPLTLPGIVAGSVITFIPALGEYLVPNLLGGLDGQMYGNLITAAFQNFNWPFGATLGVVLFVFVFAVLAVVGRLVGIERVFAAGR